MQPTILASIHVTRSPSFLLILLLLLGFPFTIPLIFYVVLFGPAARLDLLPHALFYQERPNFVYTFITGNRGNEGIYPLQHVTGFSFDQRVVSGCIATLILPLTALAIVSFSAGGTELGLFFGILALFMVLYVVLFGTRISLTVFLDNRVPIRLNTKRGPQFDAFYWHYQSLKLRENGLEMPPAPPMTPAYGGGIAPQQPQDPLRQGWGSNQV